MSFALPPFSHTPEEPETAPVSKKRSRREESTEEVAEDALTTQPQRAGKKLRPSVSQRVSQQEPSPVSEVGEKILGTEKHVELLTELHKYKTSQDFAVLVDCIAEVHENKLYQDNPFLVLELLNQLLSTDESTRSDELVGRLHTLLVAIVADCTQPTLQEALLNWIITTSAKETIQDDIAFFARTFPDALPAIFVQFESMSGIQITIYDDVLRIDTKDREGGNELISRLKQLHLPWPIEVIAPLQQRVQERCDQIKKGVHATEFETPATRLTPEKIRELAYFIEKHVVSVQHAANRFFLPTTQGLARDLQVDVHTREVYIVADPAGSQLKAQGTYKRALSAVAIPFELKKPAEQVVQVAPKPPEPTKKLDLTDVNKEVPIYERLRDVPGVAKLRSFTHLTTTFHTGELPQESISLIFNRGDKGELSHALEQRTLRVEQRRHIGRQLIHTGAEFEARSIYHGDLKPRNVLLDKHNNILVTDFGFASIIGETPPCWTLKQNSYGAWWYTPPELLTRDPTRYSFAQDPTTTSTDFMKVESWVTGCMLYEMEFGNPDWVNMLAEKKFPPKLTQEEVAKMQSEYDKKVVGLADKLLKIPDAKRSKKDRYQLAMCNLMHADPARRWTRIQAHNYLL